MYDFGGMNLAKETVEKVKNQLYSALKYSYIIEKLRQMNLIEKDTIELTLFFINQEIDCLLTRLRRLLDGEIAPDEEVEKIYNEICDKVVDEVETKWSNG